MRPCTGASEPQYTGVIPLQKILQCVYSFENIRSTKKAVTDVHFSIFSSFIYHFSFLSLFVSKTVSSHFSLFSSLSLSLLIFYLSSPLSLSHLYLFSLLSLFISASVSFHLSLFSFQSLFISISISSHLSLFTSLSLLISISFQLGLCLFSSPTLFISLSFDSHMCLSLVGSLCLFSMTMTLIQLVLSVHTALTCPECQSAWVVAHSFFGRTCSHHAKKHLFGYSCARLVPLGMKWACICAGKKNVLGVVCCGVVWIVVRREDIMWLLVRGHEYSLPFVRACLKISTR